MNLREYRYKRGFRRQFIANAAGITGKHLNDIEIAKVSLTDKVANRLAEIYGVEPVAIKQMYEGDKHEEN